MRFNYVAYTLELGLVKGTVEARGQADARVLILRQGHRPLRVVPARRPPAVDDLFPSLFQVKKTELVLFARQLATMLISGGKPPEGPGDVAEGDSGRWDEADHGGHPYNSGRGR